MNTVAKNIYRQEKHNWTPLLSFGGGISRSNRYNYDGWHDGFNVPRMRTMGMRFLDPNGVVQGHKVAKRNAYDSFETNNNWTMHLKYDISKLTGIYYRYRSVNGFLQPFSAMPELRVISIREHKTDFGHLDLSGNPKFSHLDVSTHYSTESYLGGSINQITFHPDAPLKYVYLSGCKVTREVVDKCLIQCYNHRDTPAPDGIQQNNSFLSQRVSWSASLQYMVDELKNNYGWSGFAFY
jgi:hypothetical protein